jgi:SAM-dependent methyltransferase
VPNRSIILLAGAIALPALAAEFVAPYVNTTREDVELMLEMADVGAADYVIDLGSGDGRIVINAALRGAMGHGIELDRELVALARERARAAEVSDRVAFREGDIFQADIGAATVVTMYLMPDVNLRLRPKLLAELRPGTRVLSNSFHMGEWQPDERATARASGGIMLWIIPARVEGDWSLDLPDVRMQLTITQQFQEIDVTLRRDDEELHVLEALLAGDRIVITAGDGGTRYVFNGRIDGAQMAGFAQLHRADTSDIERWRATRR